MSPRLSATRCGATFSGAVSTGRPAAFGAPLPLLLARGKLADTEQRVLCDHRRVCLDAAARAGWRAFSCAGCVDYEPMAAAERRRIERVAVAQRGRELFE